MKLIARAGPLHGTCDRDLNVTVVPNLALRGWELVIFDAGAGAGLFKWWRPALLAPGSVATETA